MATGVTEAIAVQQQEEHDREALLLLWEDWTPKPYAGLLTGDGWTWDATQQTYTSDTGTKLRQDDLRSIAIGITIAAEIEGENRAAEALANKEDDEFLLLLALFEDEYLLLAALAAGGLDELQPEDFQAVAGRLSTQIVGTGIIDTQQRLQGLIDQIKAGEASEAQAINRVGMYGQAGYQTFEEVRRNSHKRAVAPPEPVTPGGAPPSAKGTALFIEERNILDPLAEHCKDGDYTLGCVEVTASGWQPIGTLPEPGTRTCVSRCRCFMQYRKADRD